MLDVIQNWRGDPWEYGVSYSFVALDEPIMDEPYMETVNDGFPPGETVDVLEEPWLA